MSGDSTKECDRYLLAGSKGWSILKLPLPLETAPVTLRFPTTCTSALGLPGVRMMLPPGSPPNPVPPVMRTFPPNVALQLLLHPLPAPSTVRTAPSAPSSPPPCSDTLECVPAAERLQLLLVPDLRITSAPTLL